MEELSGLLSEFSRDLGWDICVGKMLTCTGKKICVWNEQC